MLDLTGAVEASEATGAPGNSPSGLNQHGGKKPARMPWLFKSRFRLLWEDSATLLIQSVLYIIVLEVVAAFGLQHIFRLFRNDIEHFLAALTGNGSLHYFIYVGLSARALHSSSYHRKRYSIKVTSLTAGGCSMKPIATGYDRQ